MRPSIDGTILFADMMLLIVEIAGTEVLEEGIVTAQATGLEEKAHRCLVLDLGLS